MLTILQAIFLGALQGVTEFLPISSSGHLVVVQQLFGWKAENGIILAFDVVLHVGTLFAVLVFFKKEIIEMLPGRAWKMAGFLFLAPLPAVIVGFSIKDFIEEMFSSVTVVGVGWLVTGVFLCGTRYINKDGVGGISPLKSFLIGCAQAVAILPGISRSGSTIAAGMFLKLDKTAAAKFSFLMAIPAIAGGAILDAKEIIAFPKEGSPQLIIGALVSFVVGYLSIRWLLSIIQRGKFWWFGIYCGLAGTFTLIWLR